MNCDTLGVIEGGTRAAEGSQSDVGFPGASRDPVSLCPGSAPPTWKYREPQAHLSFTLSGIAISRKHLAAIVLAATAATAALGSTSAAAGRNHPVATPAPTPVPAVVPVTVMPLDRAAGILRGLYPHARIEIDRASNSLVLFAPPDQLEAMRSIVQGLDVRNPTLPTNDVVHLSVVKAAVIAGQVRDLYPGARITTASASTLLVRATPQDMAEIKTLIATLDVAPQPFATPLSKDAVKVIQADPRRTARALVSQLPHLNASVSGATILLAGSPEDIASAKTLIAQLDQPGFGARYDQVYRVKNIDATSVGNLISRTYPRAKVVVDPSLNAISVEATAAEQARIGDAIGQLDGAVVSSNGESGAAYGSSNVDIVDLQSAIPGTGQGQPSTTVTDIGTAVTAALQSLAPDLRVTAVQNTNTLVLSGSPESIRLAKDLIARLDRTPPLVELDTEILEMDENVARNLGLSLGDTTISSSFSELLPNNSSNNQNGFYGPTPLQKLGRTPISFTAVLNLQIQKGNARVLADPRITTISGHTASIRAGDTISILTQTAGGPGTPVTSQVQQLQTGVTLDITPIVDASGNIKIWLHPVVNSISPVVAGVIPTISTRDTQTVVSLKDNQTLVIGGLIQEVQSKSTSKIPLLGDLPLIGRLFSSDDIEYTRNEVVIVVTPHVLRPDAQAQPPDAVALPEVPTPAPLPTLPPDFKLPSMEQFRTPAPTPQPVPSGTGATFSGRGTPAPAPGRTPSAFASANVFEYGAPPQNAYASDSDAPTIFYARFSPTIVQQGSQVTISAVASTNVKRMTIGVNGFVTNLIQVAPSQWQATYTFSTSGISSSQNTVNLTLNAYRFDGTAASSVQIPVSIYTPDNL
jgi:type II secretory pathway component GspD/PulD (secretin)